MDQQTESSYKYKGIPLTPTIIAHLLTELYEVGEVFKRDEYAFRVQVYHEQNGGAVTNSKLLTQTKKAIQILQRAGVIRGRGSYGMWEVIENNSNLPEGGALYVYTYPAYLKLAKLEGSTAYPVKVGMTALTADERILAQTTTAMPEAPLLLLEVKTESPRELERAIHGVLEYRGQALDGRVGSEWFLSSEPEIQGIIEWIENG